MNKIILVNATSLSSGGGLTILNRYIGKLFDGAKCNEIYYLFVPDNCIVNEQKENIKIIRNIENGYYKGRNAWNSYGMKEWCKGNKIDPDEIYSMQNYFPFGFNKKGIFKRLYLHQAIPFFNYKWSVLDKRERKIWFYKHIYYLLIKNSLKQADEIIVQTEWFKKQIIQQEGIEGSSIIVENPEISDINPENFTPIQNLKSGIKLFYPAFDSVYKNHDVLYNAFNILVNKMKIKDVVLYLTLGKDNIYANKMIKRYGLKDNIVLIGEVPYTYVMQMYKSVDALVFPSKIETYGLPLVEIQYFKLPIFVSDLELLREVIGNYLGGVTYCDCDNAEAWANAIKSYVTDKRMSVASQ